MIKHWQRFQLVRVNFRANIRYQNSKAETLMSNNVAVATATQLSTSDLVAIVLSALLIVAMVAAIVALIVVAARRPPPRGTLANV